MKNIIIKSSCNYTLTTYRYFLENIFKKMQIKFSIVSLPISERKITLLKSPHVNKKSKEQFQIKTYKFLVILEELSYNLLFRGFQYFILNKPKNLSIKIK